MSELTPSIPNEVLKPLANSETQEQALVPRPLRDARGRLLPGQSANLHGGSKPKHIREFEKMLRKEHMNLDKMRELFERMRNLAMGEVVLIPVVMANGSMEVQAKLNADPAFMKLYLDRVLGPVKAKDDLPENFFEGASSEVIEFFRMKITR